MAAYPRKQTAVIFVVCVLAVAGTAVYGQWSNSSRTQPRNNPEPTISAADTKASLPLDDTNWKETFLTVTDGSGGGNFKTSGAVNVSTKNTETLNSTELFGREFFSKYMTLRQAGLSTNSEATGALVEQIATEGIESATKPKTYTRAHILTHPNETALSLRTYANALGQSLTSHVPKGHEVLIATQALQTGDATLLAEIDPIITAYATIRSELLATPVPLSAADLHVDLVNGISGALTNATLLRNAMQDPLQALSAVSAFQTVESDIFYTVSDFRLYFSEHDIAFSPQESAFAVFSPK